MKKTALLFAALTIFVGMAHSQVTNQEANADRQRGFGGPGGMGGPPFMMMGNLGSIDQFGVTFDDSYLKEPDTPLPSKNDSTYKYFAESKVFDAVVDVTFVGMDAKVGVLPEGVAVEQEGAHLSFTIEGRKVAFRLKGQSDDGSLFIHSNKAVKIVLDGLDLKSQRGSVIEVKGKKPVYVELAKESENRLEDKYREVPKRESMMMFPPMMGGKNQGDFEKELVNGIEMKKAENRSKDLTKSDIDGAVKTTGLLSFSGQGKLYVKGHNKAGIRSNGHVIFRPGNVIHVEVTQGKGVYAKGDLRIYGGVLNIDGSDSGKDGIRSEGSIYVSGGRTTVKASGTESSEGIESKYNLVIDGGLVEVASFDDAINSGGNLIVNGGQVYAAAVFNDALDANSNLVLNGGKVVAFGGNMPECGLDANEEEGFELYVNGGEIMATGGHSSLPAKESRQTGVIYNAEQLDSAGVYSLVRDGKALLQVQLNRAYARGGSLFFSTPRLKVGDAYDVCSGGTLGTNDFHGVCTDVKATGTALDHVDALSQPYTVVGKEQQMFGPPPGMFNGE